MTKSYTEREVANLALVRAVYDEVLEPLDASAVGRYFLEDYIQHNPIARTGAQGLRDFLTWAKSTTPHVRRHIKRMFADDDHVIAHVHVVIEPGTAGNIVIDIFRIEAGRVAEHWDAIQPVPAQSANQNGVF